MPALIQRTSAVALTAPERRLAFDTLAFIGNREAVAAIGDFAAGKDDAIKIQAIWWLFNRGLDNWKAFGTREILAQRAMCNAQR